jgi:hypothetical protein
LRVERDFAGNQGLITDMDDISLSETSNQYWRYLLLGIAILAVVYMFTGWNWILIFLAPLVLLLVFGTGSGRAITGWMSTLIDHANNKALAEWQGNYYQWESQQIRVIESQDDVWVVDVDLIHAVGMKMDKTLRQKLIHSYSGYRKIPETKFYGFNEKSVLKFLDGKQDSNPDVIKLKLWFERGVYFPLRKKKEM